jgi:hypothetical protein
MARVTFALALVMLALGGEPRANMCGYLWCVEAFQAGGRPIRAFCSR